MAWTTFRLSLRLIYRRLGLILAGNVLWIVASLPLITLPAATGGLFYLAQLIIKEERDLDPHAARVRDFWVGMRRYWRQSTLLWLLDFLGLVFLFIALRFYLFHPIEILRWLVGPVLIFLLAALAMQLYLFPLLVVSPELSLRQIVWKAFLIVLSEPLESFMMLIWLILLTVICIVLAGPVLLLLFAVLGLIQSMMLRAVRIKWKEIPPAKADE